MPFPLVSRRAFDLALDERDRLRAQVDMLLEHRQRLERREVGLSEVPVPERKPLDPMPKKLAALANEIPTEAIRANFLAGLEKARREYGSWEVVMALPEVAERLEEVEL